ncbi:hypothetical protein KI614_14880 [Dechloromonas denitrificans]|uniref:hypothetical protein n=1 Tax=Dechloromonas denitrificans TaxID=281362 RepID=UPI001CF8950F|nr:hypothetical protein [Dechloromonas denitrificans]UCV11410.1 hypothetical protein KI614_14880 [Dechloromonas denitrificans]
MQLKRLDSTTQPRAIDARESLRQPHGEQIRRVEALAAVENDRQRSLQQEMAEVDARSLGPFEGSQQVLQEARSVAARLVVLGGHGEALIKLRALSLALPHVDDTV